MYKVGQRVITKDGVGDIIEIDTSIEKNNKYFINIEFPYINSKQYSIWMSENDIRKSLDDIRVRDIDTTENLKLRKPKEKKQVTKYSYGSYRTLWR